MITASDVRPSVHSTGRFKTLSTLAPSCFKDFYRIITKPVRTFTWLHTMIVNIYDLNIVRQLYD